MRRPAPAATLRPIAAIAATAVAAAVLAGCSSDDQELDSTDVAATGDSCWRIRAVAPQTNARPTVYVGVLIGTPRRSSRLLS